jgi:MOB kinase activator 1
MGRAPRAPKRSPTPTRSNSSQQPLVSPTSEHAPDSPIVATSQQKEKPLYLCSPFVEAALVKGNFKTIVMLPKYVDIMEWVAVNGASSTAF